MIMAKAHAVFFVCVIVFILLSGCVDEKEEASKQSVALGVSPLPKGASSAWDDDSFNEAYGTAKAGGFSVAVWRNQWGDVETASGEYDWGGFDYQVQKTDQMGLKYSLVIEVIHTNMLGKYPKDVIFTGFDDPKFVSRFRVFIRELSDRHKGKIDHIWIGNEVDLYLHDNPDQVTPFMDFCRQVEDEAKSADPNITVGVVGAYHLARNNDEIKLLQDLSEIGDAIALTVYMEDDRRNPDVSATGDYFSELLETFPDKKVAIIETSWSSRGKSGSEEKQVAYIKEASKVLDKYDERFVFFSWLILYDLDEEANRQVAESFGIDTDALGARQFLDWQGSLGLMENDGREKPAWRAWKEYMAVKG